MGRRRVTRAGFGELGQIFEDQFAIFCALAVNLLHLLGEFFQISRLALSFTGGVLTLSRNSAISLRKSEIT